MELQLHDTLSFGNQLDVFKTCLIHLIFSQLELPGSNHPLPTYDDVPLNVPSVRNVISYSQGGYSLLCDKTAYVRADHYKLPYTHKPQVHNQNCEVQVFIPPTGCEKWMYKYRSDEKWGEIIHPFHFHLYVDDGFVPKGVVTLRRPRRFIIFVTRSRDPVRYGESMFRLFDTLPIPVKYGKLKPESEAEYASLPTKIVFQIGNSSSDDKENVWKVDASYILNSVDFESTVVSHKQPCWETNRYGQLRPDQYCMREHIGRMEYPRIQYSVGDPKTNTMEKLEFLWTTLDPKQIMFFGDFTDVNEHRLDREFRQLVSTNWYLRAWKRGHRHIQFVLLSIISKNLTNAILIPGTVRFEVSRKTFLDSPFNFDEEGIHFVSCAGITERGWLSLDGYVSPFDITCWMLIISSWIATTLVLWKFFLKSICDCIFFALCILLEQGVSYFSKTKWVFGTWIMVSIVLTNCYKGENINKLIAPIPIRKLDSFTQLIENRFTIHSRNLDSDKHQIMSRIQVSIWSREAVHCDYGKMGCFTELDDMFPKRRNRREKQLLWRTWRARGREDFLAKEEPGFFLYWIQMCEKVAYVDSHHRVRQLLIRLKNQLLLQNRTNEVSMSKEPFTPLYQNWHLSRVPWPVDWVTRRMHGLKEAGLDKLWRDWELRVLTYQSNVESARMRMLNAVKKVDMNDNIAVVFLLYAVFICTPFLAFSVEIVMTYSIPCCELVWRRFKSVIRCFVGGCDCKRMNRVSRF